ncbi:MAG: DNA gyrase subunit A [Alphaproteobacteria bacterium]|nr:DNA gyrase subunit A [Alphaproteobacteria bacterium]
MSDHDQGAPAPSRDIEKVGISSKMQSSFLDYAMSVIVSRALPDVRDGLKPVHRRLMFAMDQAGFVYNRPYKKSARTVGEVLGKYHPHGDQSVYLAMVRLAQSFAMSLPLIDGQGNFGSIDGDSPAAMRYTESRLARVTTALLQDLNKDTVDFQPNFDESLKEPTVLPAQFPHLLVNGSTGIAVGMATTILPHNLGEVVDATVACLENPNLTSEELMEYLPGPDFPTGGVILGRFGAHKALTTGRGSVVVRGKTKMEEVQGREAIIITEIPYQVNKVILIEKIMHLYKEKKIENLAAIRDESDRHGIRIVIELKREAVPEVVLNQLFRYTPLQTSYGVQMLALNKGRPELMTMSDILKHFIVFRKEVIRRRTNFELNKVRDRGHILVGLSVAVANIDEIIAMIKASKDPIIAKEKLMDKEWNAQHVAPLIELIDDPKSLIDSTGMCRLTEEQAKGILELKLHRLTGLEMEKLTDEMTQIGSDIKGFLSVLRNDSEVINIIKEDLLQVKENFAVPRRTEISDNEFTGDLEDLIAKEDMVVTVTHRGYIKRVPLSTYRAQKRGGKGRNAMNTKDEDFITNVFVANTHTPLLFFSDNGMAYKLKVYKLPMGSPTSPGKALINLLPLEKEEKITTVMPLPENEESWEDLFIMFATSRGTVRRNRLSDFISVRANGKIAMKLGEDDKLVGVATCDEDQDVLLTLKKGNCIRFPVDAIRIFTGRNSVGVRGVKMKEKGDEVISLSLLHHMDVDSETREKFLKQSRAMRQEDGVEDAANLTLLSSDEFESFRAKEDFVISITDKGLGKRSSSYEYRTTNRGGTGITNMKLGEKSNEIIASFPITEDQQLILVTDQGQLIRIPIMNVRIAGRSTSGVKLFTVGDDEKVVSVAKVDMDDSEEEGDDVSSDNDSTETVEVIEKEVKTSFVEESIEEPDVEEDISVENEKPKSEPGDGGLL